MGKTIELNENSFLRKVDNYIENGDDWKYLGDKPAILEFYSVTCPHCMRMKPIVAEVAEMYADKIYIYTIDIDREDSLANLFDVEATPTFVFVPMKGELQVADGEMPIEELVAQIKKVLLV